MNTRLQQFLSLENLSPARLADILGVQRSGMSHLLSGRNKPGYDFILKLCTKFPDLNANWFITGKGKPYLDKNTSPIPSTVVSGPSGNIKNSTSAVAPVAVTSTAQPTTLTSEYSNHLQQKEIQNNEQLKEDTFSKLFNPILNPGDENMDSLFSDTDGDSIDFSSISTDNQIDTPKNTAPYPRENQINGENKARAYKNRRVKRVIIFYSDGSFDELFPAL